MIKRGKGHLVGRYWVVLCVLSCSPDQCSLSIGYVDIARMRQSFPPSLLRDKVLIESTFSRLPCVERPFINLHESLRCQLDLVYNAPGVRTTLVIAGHIMTPLFGTVRHPASFLYKFIFNSLMAVDVAEAIVAALDG